MKQKHFIDFHKGINSIFILLLMYYFDSWNNIVAWIYLALHGTYGYMWILKSKIFPDRQWESKTSIRYGLFIWLGLSLYWISPYIIISGNSILPFSIPMYPIYIFFCLTIYIFGVFLHFTSDMQKYIQLKYNPSNLIDNGMFKSLRNTNYLGELLIYLGFSLLALDWTPIIALMIFIIFIWIPNMYKKDTSLSKYSEFKKYKSKTKRFIPFLW
ncbi:MAG: steroid 5-alpha reductase [Candidatus Marinimicrobia bacterium]|nr:steroid 5-alpha reductase [Candidatus Neomarinimicrobiota bacterium]